jgi:hypothetical protein
MHNILSLVQQPPIQSATLDEFAALFGDEWGPPGSSDRRFYGTIGQLLELRRRPPGSGQQAGPGAWLLLRLVCGSGSGLMAACLLLLSTSLLLACKGARCLKSDLFYVSFCCGS